MTHHDMVGMKDYFREEFTFPITRKKEMHRADAVRGSHRDFLRFLLSVPSALACGNTDQPPGAIVEFHVVHYEGRLAF